ncbi:MAG: hypothetical protein KDA33_00885 [Phycisphaerales bacterium]|nr:hypothetical protein [Phycisphaerales bacterium]
MSHSKLRRQIARRAAQLMYARDEKEYYTAKRKAAREFGLGPRTRPTDLPANREIRDEIEALALFYEGERRAERLTDMRLEALRMMRILTRFHPHLIGSTLTGHVRRGSDIDLHVFTDTTAELTRTLDEHGMRYSVERKRIIKHGEERHFTHIHVDGESPIELTVYSLDKVNYPFRSSITGKTIERASHDALATLILNENPGIDLESALCRAEDFLDRFELYRSLLLPLENVKQNPKWHPEGDALYHSLQVFELARDERPYDEEFLLAALLHDVGKAIDPGDHVGAGLLALEGTITDRTTFLIEHHMIVQELRAGTLGQKATQRLRRHEDYDDLLLLGELDQRGRVPGAEVGDVDEALAFIRELAEDA